MIIGFLNTKNHEDEDNIPTGTLIKHPAPIQFVS